MRQRRRLSDLYIRGKEVALNDGAGEPVTVWLQKLNTVDRDACLRRANAAKARFMLEGDNEDSETFQAMYAQVRAMSDRDGLIAIIIAEDLAQYRQRIEAELAGDEENWGKDNYIGGLVDAWIGDDDNPGLAATHAEDPEDPEAKRVLAEIERFEDEINQAVKQQAERLTKEWEDVPPDAMWRQATHRVIEIRGTETFNAEFERQQLFYAVREPDNHAKRYFATLAEVDDLDDHLKTTLLRHHNLMTVEAVEGKGSRASHDSSNSSDPSSEAETPSASGPEDANA